MCIHVGIHKVQGPLLSGRTSHLLLKYRQNCIHGDVVEVSRHDDEGTGVFSLKLGDAGVRGAAGRCWVCRGRDVQDNNDDMWDLSRQMVWMESNSKQFNIQATELFFNCDVTRITPSAIHWNGKPPSFPLTAVSTIPVPKTQKLCKTTSLERAGLHRLTVKKQ